MRWNGRRQRNGLTNGRDTIFASLNTIKLSAASMVAIWIADVVPDSVLVRVPVEILWPIE